MDTRDLKTLCEEKRFAKLEITVKEVAESPDFWTIKGMATTPKKDLVGDIVEPMGAVYQLPIKLLWQHDSSKPIGNVVFAKQTKGGIPYEAQIPKVVEPGIVKDRVDEAIHSLKYKLVTNTSIGFKPLADEIELLKDGGLRFLKWLWLELSLATIPANDEATVTAFKSLDGEIRSALEAKQLKSIDEAQRATSGQRSSVVRLDPPAVAGKEPTTRKGTTVNRKEAIASFEAKRAANEGRMDELENKSTEEGRTFLDDEKEEYLRLKTEVKSIDEQLVILREREASAIAKATPITPDTGMDQPDEQKKTEGNGVVTWGKSRLPPGIRFARYAMCIANAKGNLMQAEILSRRFNDSSPEVNLALKGAVAAGTTQDSTWAAPLVQLQEMQSEFVEFLRPQTLLGRIPGIRRVPFNIKFTRQTSGTSGTFVGEGLPKPLGKMDFDLLSLTWAKAATIIVMTDELVRFSNPSAEMLARDDLARGIAQYLDKRFIDPSYAGVANVSPASVTHNAPTIQSLGSTIALISDTVEAAVRTFIAAENLGSLVWIMSPGTALSLSFRRTTQDIFAFPGLGPNGGTFMGYPVITSNNVLSAGSPGEGQVILMNPSEILLADDGGVSIDMSTEASLQMDGAPTNPVTSSVSLWQSNLVGLRAERYINWMKRRDTAVTVIGGVEW